MSIITRGEMISDLNSSMVKVDVPAKFVIIAFVWGGNESEAFLQQCYLCCGWERDCGQIKYITVHVK